MDATYMHKIAQAAVRAKIQPHLDKTIAAVFEEAKRGEFELSQKIPVPDEGYLRDEYNEILEKELGFTIHHDTQDTETIYWQ